MVCLFALKWAYLYETTASVTFYDLHFASIRITNCWFRSLNNTICRYCHSHWSEQNECVIGANKFYLFLTNSILSMIKHENSKFNFWCIEFNKSVFTLTLPFSFPLFRMFGVSMKLQRHVFVHAKQSVWATETAIQTKTANTNNGPQHII